MRVKVCGVTRVRDALHAESCGANAIGVVMCSASARAVSPGQAARIFSALAPSTIRVAVTDTVLPGDIREILSIRPDAVQVTHPFPFPMDRPFQVFRVIRKGEPVPLQGLDYLVLDESHGSGRKFDPGFAREMVRLSPLPVILSGGLTPGNVRSAIMQVRPAMVDVSSGVETSPGIKDNQKVQEFMACCREL